MTAGDKTPRRLETRRRVEQKSQARNPSAGLDAELTERVARDVEHYCPELGTLYEALWDDWKQRESMTGAECIRRIIAERDQCIATIAELCALVERARPLVAHAVDVPRREFEAQQWLNETEALKDAPSVKAPTSVARDAPSSTTPERRSRKEG